MKRANNFDIKKWRHELSELWNNYFLFYDFMNQEDLFLKYRVFYHPLTAGFSTIYYKKENNEKLEDFELKVLARLLEPRHNITYTFSRLMIVGVSSIMEFMIEEFFQLLFSCEPHKMIKYNKEYSKLIETANKIPPSFIKELLQNDSIKEFISDLAIKNAETASDGKKYKVLKRLNDFSEYNFSGTLFKNIQKVWTKRNIIVHKNSEEKIEFGFVYYSIKTALLFLKSLAQCAEKIGIPYDSPEEFLDDYFSDQYSLGREINELKELSYDEYLSDIQEFIPIKFEIRNRRIKP